MLALCLSCAKENEGMESVPGLCLKDGDPIDLVLDFGAPKGTVFDINTKTDMGMEAESKVWNLYIFLFDCDGNKFYGNYFDVSSKDNTTLADYWTVNNYNGDDIDKTSGTIHFHTVYKADDESTPSKDESKITVVGITNIDSSILNVSPEQLGNVSTYSQLYALAATLNQPIVERTGYFPMSGELKNVQMQSSGGTMRAGGANAKLILQRMDAKIMFRIKVATGQEGVCEIKSFTPDRWEVCNLPNKSYILEHGAYSSSRDAYLDDGGYDSAVHSGISDKASDPEADFFNTNPANYHAETIPDNNATYFSTLNPIVQHEFTFYMMENRRAPKSPSPYSWTYQDREKRTKSDTALSGRSSTTTNGAFQYAPDLGTYVKFGGFLEMAIPSNLPGGESFTLSASVEYIVHLGNFSNDHYADFDVFRNHTYIYNVTIYDADSIRVEVEENFDPWTSNNLDEPEPGATGLVTVSREEIFDCDAHYNTHVITFHLDNMIAKDEENRDIVEDLTWYVKTPFNPEGEQPQKRIVNGVEVEVYDGFLDYQWVEFRLNEIDENGEYYDQRRQIYVPHTRSGSPYADGNTMDIADLVVFLKKEAQKAIDGSADCKFDQAARRKICVTAFINEYYYETNPITGSFEPDIWKRSVNQPMRYMHILAGSQKSADAESRGITASFTIRQKSIQSIYNTNNDDLVSAWGSEHFDDDFEMGGTGNRVYSPSGGTTDRGNTSLTNGRMNTLKEWGLINKNNVIIQSGGVNILNCPTPASNPSTPALAKWSNYLELEGTNVTPLMKPSYQFLRYSCMSRNRDNNGNGVIDEDEVRWYMGATNQLYGLFLGSYGIDGDAKLYQRGVSERASTVNTVWRQHILSSTRESSGTNSNDNPRVIWAEEGVTGSTPAKSKQFSNIETYNTRCLRNLGTYNNVDITGAAINIEPQNYITVKRYKNGAEYPSESDIESIYATNGDYIYPNEYKWDGNISYEFDCTRMNKASLRYYWPRELDFTDEFDQAACLPPKFRVAAKNANPNIDKADIPGLSNNNFEGINNYLNANIGDNPFCPPGYRLPNIRELVMLRYFLPETMTTMNDSFIGSGINVICRTYWSFGKLGSHDKTSVQVGDGKKGYMGWATTNQKILMTIINQHTTTSVRCVQDIDPSLP